MISRVVFDTNTVISALLFVNGRLVWLRDHWADANCVPLVSRETAAELARVLAYPKFQLSMDDRLELIGDYLPYCETVEITETCTFICRDPKDQPFLDLAQSAIADLLVSGDNDLLALAGKTAFTIETPEDYRSRIHEADPT